jgi:hypothetical protein
VKNYSIYPAILVLGALLNSAWAETGTTEYKMKIAPSTGTPAPVQCNAASHNQLGPAPINMPISMIGLTVTTSPTQPSEVSISLFPLRLDVTLKCDPGKDSAISCTGPPSGHVVRRAEMVRVRWRSIVWSSIEVFITGWFNQNGLDLKVVMGNMGGTIAATGKKGPCWLSYQVTGRNLNVVRSERERYSQQ